MKLCFIDCRLSDTQEAALALYGYSAVRLKALDSVPPAIASHTDIICFRHGNKIFAPECRAKELASLLPTGTLCEVIACKTLPQGNYPADTPYNALVIGNYLFARLQGLCPEILDYAKGAGLQLIDVRQGYARCTVLPVTESAAITADQGMADALIKCGIEVLNIKNDSAIYLPPYEYGFIGGSAEGDGDNIFFFGNLNSHKCAREILAFINAHGKNAISLDGDADRLFDLGGALFV